MYTPKGIARAKTIARGDTQATTGKNFRSGKNVIPLMQVVSSGTVATRDSHWIRGGLEG